MRHGSPYTKFRTLPTRTRQGFDLYPAKLIGDTAYGMGRDAELAGQ
jgi:hypothetical protein